MSKFSEWNKPIPPLEPNKELSNFVKITSKEVSEERLSLEDFKLLIPADATHIEFGIYSDYDYAQVNIDFIKLVKYPNPHYEKLAENYKKDFAKYQEKLATWEKQKKEHDAKKKENYLARDLALFNKLKKKLGK